MLGGNISLMSSSISEFDPSRNVGPLDDMSAFDVNQLVWTDLSSSQDVSTRPSARFFHGFAAANDKIYLFGGSSAFGLFLFFYWKYCNS